jgi:hypothetical protein
LTEVQARLKEARRAWELELGSRLGQLPLDGSQPFPGFDRGASRWGMVMRSGPRLRFVVDFKYATQGPPALAEWLYKRECFEMKYEFKAGDATGSLTNSAAPIKEQKTLLPD